jgi:aminomethyltransferase
VTETVRSVLHEVQEARGATFRDDGGWWWTDSFGDHPAGYEAVRGGAALWDVYPMVKWVVTGPDAQAAIQRVFTRDITTQKPGQVRYGPFVDENGFLVDDGTVFKHSDELWWALTNTELGEWWAENTKGLDVHFELSTHEMPLLSLQGPKSREILQSLTDIDVSSLRYFNFLTEKVDIAGVSTWLMRTGFSGEIGYELIPSRDGAVPLWNALCEAGAVPMGLDTLEPVRLEAGLIVYEQDYFPGESTPYDVSLDRLVALDSDVEFLGKAKLAEIASAPPKRFKTLVLEGTDLPEEGADVLRDGAVVGILTSRIISPQFGLIAFAQLDTAVSDDGTKLEVTLGDATVPATVAVLSIKDPTKALARG